MVVDTIWLRKITLLRRLILRRTVWVLNVLASNAITLLSTGSCLSIANWAVCPMLLAKLGMDTYFLCVPLPWEVRLTCGPIRMNSLR